MKKTKLLTKLLIGAILTSGIAEAKRIRILYAHTKAVRLSNGKNNNLRVILLRNNVNTNTLLKTNNFNSGIQPFGYVQEIVYPDRVSRDIHLRRLRGHQKGKLNNLRRIRNREKSDLVQLICRYPIRNTAQTRNTNYNGKAIARGWPSVVDGLHFRRQSALKLRTSQRLLGLNLDAQHSKGYCLRTTNHQTLMRNAGTCGRSARTRNELVFSHSYFTYRGNQFLGDRKHNNRARVIKQHRKTANFR